MTPYCSETIKKHCKGPTSRSLALSLALKEIESEKLRVDRVWLHWLSHGWLSVNNLATCAPWCAVMILIWYHQIQCLVHHHRSRGLLIWSVAAGISPFWALAKPTTGISTQSHLFQENLVVPTLHVIGFASIVPIVRKKTWKLEEWATKKLGDWLAGPGGYLGDLCTY